MTADRLLTQHKLEGMAKRLRQLQHHCDDMLHNVTLMDHWCDELLMIEQGKEIQLTMEHMKSALISVQIDLDSTRFTLETAQLRASATARLLANYITFHGADDEKQ
jgi:hypothetical protein